MYWVSINARSPGHLNIFRMYVLSFQYSILNHIIFCMVFTSCENISHHFEKGLKGGNPEGFQKEPLSCGILVESSKYCTKKIMTLRKWFYEIPCRNGGLSKETSCISLTLPSRTVLTYTPLNCTIVFIFPSHFNKRAH